MESHFGVKCTLRDLLPFIGIACFGYFGLKDVSGRGRCGVNHDIRNGPTAFRERCPSQASRLPNCLTVPFGELCEGDGECDTNPSLNNCGGAEICQSALAPPNTWGGQLGCRSLDLAMETLHFPTPDGTLVLLVLSLAQLRNEAVALRKNH